jgi:hypothetical protein
MAAEPQDLNGPGEPMPEVTSRRGRRFLRIFLMAAGGLAAPCLALAAFFLSNSGGSDTPTAKAGVVQGGQVTTATTARKSPAAPVTTTTTAPPTSPVSPPARDPFQPLVVQAPAGGTPAR